MDATYELLHLEKTKLCSVKHRAYTYKFYSNHHFL
jgi:hypothetical protein